MRGRAVGEARCAIAELLAFPLCGLNASGRWTSIPSNYHIDVKHAVVVTAEEEDALWKSNVIGDGSPLALKRAISLVNVPTSVEGLEIVPVCSFILTRLFHLCGEWFQKIIVVQTRSRPIKLYQYML